MREKREEGKGRGRTNSQTTSRRRRRGRPERKLLRLSTLSVGGGDLSIIRISFAFLPFRNAGRGGREGGGGEGRKKKFWRNSILSFLFFFLRCYCPSIRPPRSSPVHSTNPSPPLPLLLVKVYLGKEGWCCVVL